MCVDKVVATLDSQRLEVVALQGRRSANGMQSPPARINMNILVRLRGLCITSRCLLSTLSLAVSPQQAQ